MSLLGGRGHELSFSPVKELALKHGLTIYQPIKVKEPDFLTTIQNLKPEVIVVAAFGQILPKAFLDIPTFGCINVHASLLPRYRGAAPIQYSIIEGEKETGITIMYMDVGVDTGDIILQRSLPIASKETGGTLFDKMAGLGSDLIVEALEQINNKTAVRIPQDNERATHVKMISKEMGRIDFAQSALCLERLIRGLNPWPSAYTSLGDKTLKLWQAEVEEDVQSGKENFLPGQVTEIRKDAIVIKTGDGLLVVKELQLEGKKRMTADSFLRGYPITSGQKLG